MILALTFSRRVLNIEEHPLPLRWYFLGCEIICKYSTGEKYKKNSICQVIILVRMEEKPHS